MNDDKGIMKFESALPADFDGVFRFTNWSDEDFVGVWGGKSYTFAALTTSPMIITEHSPIEIQHIRKKFAKDLAEREFFKSRNYEALRSTEGAKNDGMLNPRLNSIHQATAYTLTELTPFIQRCLEPLPVSRAIVQAVETPKVEEKLTRNEDGELNTEAIDKKTSLKEKALKAK